MVCEGWRRRESVLPEVSADVRGEEAVDHGVGGAVEGSQALDERRHGEGGLALRDLAVHLEQVVHEVGAPAQDEDCKDM
ncbi:hypothetical protein CEXT_116091 [Caerostris extrusa]|uniref:Uncharacterized protein n=1 Tax=Caerostris extrusa TaxID=172846 RepID=A0AAV4N0P1_CAEEX|nr:hypothetical protein CEXT_116091 [Caerostris extrusa]